MKIYNIYFIGHEKSLVSLIFLKNLIKFSKNNSKYNLVHIINSSVKVKTKVRGKMANKIILLIYYFLNRSYFERLNLIENIKLKYKNFFYQAKLNNILFDNFENFKKKKIKNNSILISCGGCILEKKFLDKFNICINYHHSKLPDFRGVNTNALELYHKKLYTYFSWHYINQKVDAGYVFYKEKIKIEKKIKHSLFYEIKKITIASKNIDKTLYLAIRKKKYKFFTNKKGDYFQANYFKNLFSNLENYSYVQIKKYLKIFGGIYYKGQFITKIRKNKKEINLKDCKIKICDINFIPVYIYKIYKFITS